MRIATPVLVLFFVLVCSGAQAQEGSLALVDDPMVRDPGLGRLLHQAGIPDAEVLTIGQLSLPVGTPIWVAQGAEVRYCQGAPQAQEHIAAMVTTGVAAMDELNNEVARESFVAAEHLLPCADERLDSDTLWDLYFSAGILASYAGEQEEAVRLFREAALARPEGVWDSSYSPAVKDDYVTGRERAATAKRVQLRLVDPGAEVTEAFLDGNPLLLDQENTVTRDWHLLQVRTQAGSFVSMNLSVTGDVTVRTRSSLRELILHPGDEAEEAQAGAVLDRLLSARKVGSVLVVDVAAGMSRWWDGAWQDVTSSTKPQRLVQRAPSGSVAVLVALWSYAGQGQASPLLPMVGPAVLGQIDLAPHLALDLGAQLGFTRLQGPYGSFLPLLRAGLRFPLGQAKVRPSIGAVALLAVHEQSPKASVGAALVAGLRIPIGPIGLRVELEGGYNRSLILGGGFGLEFRR